MSKKFEGKKVLVLEGYCKQSLPFIRGFRDFGCEVTVLCGSKWDCCYASRLPKHKIIGICDVHKPKESEEYIKNLIKTGIYDLIFAPFDFSARILANNKEELSKFAKIYSNDKDVFNAASDKEQVMKVCMENGIPCPKTYFNVESLTDLKTINITYPIIIKPKSMYGARGFHIFNSFEELKSYHDSEQINLKDYVVQEFIPLGSQVMAGIHFIDRYNEIKSGCLYKCDHLYPEEAGTSTLNSLLNRPDIDETCRRIISKMNLQGIVGVDLMIDRRDNIGKVIEINVRPPHAVTIAFEGGINLAQQILEDAFEEEVTPMKITKDNFCLRILQTDVLWFIKSPNRFNKSPRNLGFKHIKEQMFYWDDPLPWFAFLAAGLKDFRKKMREKRK